MVDADVDHGVMNEIKTRNAWLGTDGAGGNRGLVAAVSGRLGAVWPRAVGPVLVGLGLVAVGTTSSPEASACSGVYAFDVAQTYQTVPANGGPILAYHCQIGTSGCAISGPVTLERDGEPVPGTTSHLGETMSARR